MIVGMKNIVIVILALSPSTKMHVYFKVFFTADYELWKRVDKVTLNCSISYIGYQVLYTRFAVLSDSNLVLSENQCVCCM